MYAGFPNNNDFFGNSVPQPLRCECCRSKSGVTSATSGTFRKWTKKEIETEIIVISKELANSKWIDRGDLRRRLKHWVEKLQRYEQFKEEFN